MAARDQPHPDVLEALEGVKSLIEEVVRKEQHRNDLTSLPNERALDKLLDDALEDDADAWCALVEVDHFKRLNRMYSYEQADQMLKAVGAKLSSNVDLFGVGTVAFHAHGDEFYLAASGAGPDDAGPDDADIEKSLDLVRRVIAQVREHVPDKPEPMHVTVTVGWMRSSDLAAGVDVTRRAIKVAAEEAVSQGKRSGRDCVVHYQPSSSGEVHEDRDNCSQCTAAFTVDVDKSRVANDDFWYCPNCGSHNKRGSCPPTTRTTG
jgi:diguanylate cyclase (GGDEF)-like protein